MISTLRTCTPHVNVVCHHHNLNDHSIHKAMTTAQFTIRLAHYAHQVRSYELPSFRSCVAQTFFSCKSFFGNDGHSPSTVFWKHGALGRCSGNVNALGSAVPSSRSCNGQRAPTAAAPPFEVHTQMLRRLHELQPNLAFKQSQRREAIAVLTTRHPHGIF